MEAMKAEIDRLGADAIVCVISTTSCFAPRAADDVVGIAKVAEATGVGHIINNAYGVQSAAICAAVTAAWRRGRVDAVVQSTDKNFMVPVGGAVVAAGQRDPSLVHHLNHSYPGRASIAPLLDLLLTLLHLGEDGWAAALARREALFLHSLAVITETAAALGTRVLSSPGNPISIAMSLDTLDPGDAEQPAITFLGSMLWSRCVSGTRVVARGKRQSVGGLSFDGYGSSHDAYPTAYLTAAAAIGAGAAEMDEFCVRLKKCVQEYRNKCGGG
jgi:O-phospho-L-seryl-tRNASec:L-selenocysteinyl-tRNA synthase